jgi:hypothetical protein
MSRPVWTTAAGSLGTIQENDYYSLPVVATAGSSDIVYSLVAGKLPQGLIIRRDGVLEGQPTTKVDVAGIPSEVGQNVQSIFAIRATADGYVNDRTFTLTVTGQDAPSFTTSAGRLGTFIDGQKVNLQLTAHDPDPDDTYSFEKIGGELPPGVTMDSTGKITGWITPSKIAGSPTAGFDATFYEQYAWDFTNNFISKAYEFTVAVTDTKDTAIRVFNIDVKASTSLRASTDALRASSTIHTTDSDILHSPVIRNKITEFTNVLHSNKWYLAIDGYDYDNTQITYSISGGTLPPGLSLDASSGWITGNLPNITDIKKDYAWIVRVTKTDNPNYYNEQEFKLGLVIDSNITPTWITPALLGTVISGEPSRLYVEVSSTQLESFTYRVKSGIANGLPQGLRLETDGTISGVPSFVSFSNDNNTTTYDKKATTWDKQFKITIQAINAAGSMRAERQFTITVTNENFKPYENIYIANQSSSIERERWDDIINNKNNIPQEFIYRPNDPFFGLELQPKMLLAHGLNPKLSAEYMTVLQKNFYKQEFNYGSIKTAQAVDPNTDKVVYEVVYVDILDRNTEYSLATGKMIPGNVAITANSATTITNYSAPLTVDEITKGNTNLITGDVKNKTNLYPSGLEIMRQAIISGIGQLDSRVLPLWMRSAQEDGKILGYVPAVVLCYAKPGKSAQIKYYLDNDTTVDLRTNTFTVDRCLWDNSRSKNFNKTTQKWNSKAETTFDSDTTSFEGSYTSFFGGVDQREATWNTGDQYLKFPREHIMDTPN